MTPLSLERVVACLTSPTRRAGASAWEATTLDLAGGGIFGGELLGQSISIASQLDPTMPVRSISAVFPRGARDTGSLEFTSAVLHKGSAYSTQRIEVHQTDRDGAPVPCFSSTVVCHRTAAGVDHGATMPGAAGRPDDARRVDLTIIPWETRIVGDTDLDERARQPNELMLWMHVPVAVGDGLALHQSLLAYLSDLTLIGTALLQHDGWSQLDAHATLRTSVITHQLVFHRQFRVDEWLLIHQTSPAAADGSAFGVGHVYSQDGRLVASIVQESMIRVPG